MVKSPGQALGLVGLALPFLLAVRAGPEAEALYPDLHTTRLEYENGGPDGDFRVVSPRGFCRNLFCNGSTDPCKRVSMEPHEYCECYAEIDGTESCKHISPDSPFVCGNGFLELGEDCDDGNIEDNDGCNSRCFLEDTHHCEGTNDVLDVRNGLVCTRKCGDFIFDPRCPPQTYNQI